MIYSCVWDVYKTKTVIEKIKLSSSSSEKNLKMPKTFLDRLRTNSGTVKTHLILLTKLLIILLFLHRPVKVFNVSQTLNLPFSNVPQKWVKTMENLIVRQIWTLNNTSQSQMTEREVRYNDSLIFSQNVRVKNWKYSSIFFLSQKFLSYLFVLNRKKGTKPCIARCQGMTELWSASKTMVNIYGNF